MNLDQNMGTTDRNLRTLAAMGIVALTATGILKGRKAKALLGLATIFIGTSASGWCPLYSAAGVNSITEAERTRQFNEKVFNIL